MIDSGFFMRRRDVLKLLSAAWGRVRRSEAAAVTARVEPTRLDRVQALAEALSEALMDHEDGRWFVTVYPADQVVLPVVISSLQASLDAEDMSAMMAEAIHGHAVAYSDLGQAARAADRCVPGQFVSPADEQRLADASDQAEQTLMDLCRFPARNDLERREKAAYLLRYAETCELEADHLRAILQSIVSADSEALSVQPRPHRPASRDRHG